jgi:hypothetical protein
MARKRDEWRGVHRQEEIKKAHPPAATEGKFIPSEQEKRDDFLRGVIVDLTMLLGSVDRVADEKEKGRKKGVYVVLNCADQQECIRLLGRFNFKGGQRVLLDDGTVVVPAKKLFNLCRQKHDAALDALIAQKAGDLHLDVSLFKRELGE